jgi:hypothetical protein
MKASGWLPDFSFGGTRGPSSSRPIEPEGVGMVSALEEIARTDTGHRDLYLQRARALLARRLPETEYRHLLGEREAIEDLLRLGRSALARHEWPRVAEIVDQVRVRRQAVESHRALLDLGAKIYDGRDVPLAPFSEGLRSAFPSTSTAAWPLARGGASSRSGRTSMATRSGRPVGSGRSWVGMFGTADAIKSAAWAWRMTATRPWCAWRLSSASGFLPMSPVAPTRRDRSHACRSGI